MKKIIQLMVAALMLTFFACSNAAQEKKEKAKQDSVKTADSLKIVSLKEKIKNDSIAKAKKEDSLANIKKQQEKKNQNYDDCGN